MAQQDRTCTNNCSVVCGECQVFKPMAQQTAVEWFHKETWKLKIKLEEKEVSVGEFAVIYGELLEQAKQMEREQKEECWNVAHQAGRFEGKGIAEENWQTFEQYYNETYGKQNEDLTFKKKSQWTKIDKKQP